MSSAGSEALTWTQMLERIAAAAGRRKWIVPMPIAVMKFGAMLFGWLPFFPVTSDQLTMLAEGNTADPDALISLIMRDPLGFTPETLSYLRA